MTNVLLHSFNAFVVTLLALALGRVSYDLEWLGRGSSCLAGLVFPALATHPEAVSWISGRADLLVTLFSLLSILGYLLHLQQCRRVVLGASLAVYAVALVAKESAPPSFRSWSSLACSCIAIRGRGSGGSCRTGRSRWATSLAAMFSWARCSVGAGGRAHEARCAGYRQAVRLFPSRALIPAIGTIDVGGVVVPVNVIVFGGVVLALIAASVGNRERRLTRAVFVMAACGAWCLNENWRSAGYLARSIMEDVCCARACRRVVVINVPDSVHSAYVFRREGL
jgi:hypothetical protein